MAIEFEKKVLKNGLRVVLASMKNTEAITLLVLVGVGSRHETKNVNGISHFLEHMFFKGTKSRPRPGQVFRDLDRIGAAFNAFTKKDMTGFWVKTSSKDFGVGLDVVSDILLEPLFNKEEIEKERGVILQEIGMYEDEPRNKVWDNLFSVLYGDQPLGWSIAGPKETVLSIKRKDVIDYKSKNYLSKNMVVVLAGDFENGDIFPKVEKVFGRISPGKNRSAKKAGIDQKSPRVGITNKASDQTHLLLAAKSFGLFDERRYGANVLDVILGGNISSRLFSEIREKLGLAYYVFSDNSYFEDTGFLGIGTGTGHGSLETCVRKTLEILKKLKNKKVSTRELGAAKSFLRGRMALGMEMSDAVAGYCAENEFFFHRIEQPEEYLEKIEKVSQNDILKIASDMFKPNKMSMAVIGAHEDAQKKEEFYKKLISEL